MVKQVAVLGLGIMGGGIARNLLKAGYAVVAHNRTPSRAQPLVELGAVWADAPRDAAAQADVVISVVGDDAASRAMWLGERGALDALRPGAVAVECSTLSIDWVREWIALVQARGARPIDAPMAGSKVAAANGQLSLLIGADEDVLEAIRPILQAFSQTIVRMGPPGSGAMYKLINNMMVAVHVAALSEGLAMAERAGLDMSQVLQAVSNVAVNSAVVKMKAPAMIAHDHADTHFALKWMHKDVTYALRAADELGAALPTAALVRELLRMAMQKGWGEQDFAVVGELMRE